MLTADQLDALSEPIVQLYARYEDSIIRDIARRLGSLGKVTETAAWQMQRLIQSGAVYETALEELAKLTGQSEAVLRQVFEKAGVTGMRFDDSIYRAAGLNPLPLNLSPAMAQVLAAGLAKTSGIMRNLTMTTAIDAQESFIQALDLAYMQVSTGAMSYNDAMRRAVKDMAARGLRTVSYAGHTDQMDVAVRRAILTGVNQTTGKLTEARADELGVDLVQTSAHIGARPEHQVWQGQVFSRSGMDKRYPPFVESTGYGTGAGLGGWNCRHSFYPFFDGISENAYSEADRQSFASKAVTYNGKELSVYDATQQQRYIERGIRHWKRQAGALEASGLKDPETLDDLARANAKVREWQGRMREFTRQTGLSRQRIREQVLPGDRNLPKREVSSSKPVIPSQVATPIHSPMPVTELVVGNGGGKSLDLVQVGKVEEALPVGTGTLPKINFTSDQIEIIGKTSDLRNYFPIGTPGRKFIIQNDVDLFPKRKKHILKDHSGHIAWLESSSDIIRQTLISPDFIDAVPFTSKGHWAVTHVAKIEHPSYSFLVIGVRFRKAAGKNHEVLTMFLADRRFVFEETGELKERWKLIK